MARRVSSGFKLELVLVGERSAWGGTGDKVGVGLSGSRGGGGICGELLSWVHKTERNQQAR